MSLTAALNTFEYLERRADALPQLVAAFQIHQLRRLRLDRPIVDERSRTEVSQADAAEHPMQVVDAGAGGYGAVRLGDVAMRQLHVLKQRARPREIAVEREPLPRTVIV